MEIVSWLANKRVETTEYFTVEEIADGLSVPTNQVRNGSFHRKLKQLTGNFLQRKFESKGSWNGLQPVYRLREDKILVEHLKG